MIRAWSAVLILLLPSLAAAIWGVLVSWGLASIIAVHAAQDLLSGRDIGGSEWRFGFAILAIAFCGYLGARSLATFLRHAWARARRTTMSAGTALRELRLAVLRAIAPVCVMTTFVAFVASDTQPMPWWGWLAMLYGSGLPLFAALVALVWATSRRAAAEE